MIPFLVALQASGMILDWFNKSNQVDQARKAALLEQNAIKQNILLSRVQSEQESLNSMIDLRKNLGTQAAIFAARGINPAAGTATLNMQESLSNFNQGERVRKVNQLVREQQLKAKQLISQMHETGTESNIWGNFAQNIFKTASTRPEAYSGMFNGMFGSGAKQSQSRARNYGLTNVNG
jgi:hypothetical protein